MPAERTIMRQVREVLRLKFVGGVPIREIARRIGVAATAMANGELEIAMLAFSTFPIRSPLTWTVRPS